MSVTHPRIRESTSIVEGIEEKVFIEKLVKRILNWKGDQNQKGMSRRRKASKSIGEDRPTKSRKRNASKSMEEEEVPSEIEEDKAFIENQVMELLSWWENRKAMAVVAPYSQSNSKASKSMEIKDNRPTKLKVEINVNKETFIGEATTKGIHSFFGEAYVDEAIEKAKKAKFMGPHESSSVALVQPPEELSSSVARILLDYNWKLNYGDEEKVGRFAGLAPISPRTLKCGICFALCSLEMLKSPATCYHLFCEKCLQGYIHEAIDDPDSCILTQPLKCPKLVCFASVGQEMIFSLAAGNHKQSYIRNFVEYNVMRMKDAAKYIGATATIEEGIKYFGETAVLEALKSSPAIQEALKPAPAVREALMSYRPIQARYLLQFPPGFNLIPSKAAKRVVRICYFTEEAAAAKRVRRAASYMEAAIEATEESIMAFGGPAIWEFFKSIEAAVSDEEALVEHVIQQCLAPWGAEEAAESNAAERVPGKGPMEEETANSTVNTLGKLSTSPMRSTNVPPQLGAKEAARKEPDSWTMAPYCQLSLVSEKCTDC